MIWNVIDRRTRPYRWKRVNAIIEAVEHDNSVADADQALESGPLDVIDYDQREGVTVREAIDWANNQRSLSRCISMTTVQGPSAKAISTKLQTGWIEAPRRSDGDGWSRTDFDATE